MHMKSLLLGAVSVIIVSTGAKASDAVMAEPEAVEYVRVCDAYGEGYFYIPGTKTCLRIGGYVRYDMGWGKLAGNYGQGLDTDADGIGDAWDKNARLSFQISTSSDTELGTLSTFSEVRFNYENNDATIGTGPDGILDTEDDVFLPVSSGSGTPTLNFAYIQLGGLRIGKDESVFTTWTGYAGNVLWDDQAVAYGPFDVTLISYTFDAGNGFSAILSLEDDNGAGSGYIPNVTLGAKYAKGSWSVSGVVGYDESVSEWAGKLRLDASAGNFSAFVMGAYGSGPSFYQTWGGDWAIWGGASYKVSDKIALNAQLAYDNSQVFGAAANVVYTPVPGFDVTTEVEYNGGSGGTDTWGGIIRFQRSF
jgi:opacity protein-like surface antigen